MEKKDKQEPGIFKKMLSEIKFPLELITFWRKKGELKKIAIKRKTRPIMVLPGLCTWDLFTLPLRRLLKQKGFPCYGWEMGINKGYNREKLKKLRKRIKNISKKHNSPLILIGWSMGGIYARELGWKDPDRIEKIITLGSPFKFPKEMKITKLYKIMSGHEAEELELKMKKHQKENFPVPILAISTEKDGFVPWRHCLKQEGGDIEFFNVEGAHLGLPHNYSAIKKILETL